MRYAYTEQNTDRPCRIIGTEWVPVHWSDIRNCAGRYIASDIGRALRAINDPDAVVQIEHNGRTFRGKIA